MMKETGGSAFPLFDGSAIYGGLTARDWFAGMALQGLLSGYKGPTIPWNECNPMNVADEAYNIADAMLKTRSK